MENDNYDVEEQGCSFFSGKHSYIARSCCVVFILVICLIVLLSVIFAFMQRPVNLNPDTPTNSSAYISSEETTSSKPRFQSLLTTRRFTFDQLFSGKQFLTDSYDYIWLPDGSFVLLKNDESGSKPKVSRIPLGSFESKPFLNSFEYSKSLSSDSKYAFGSQKVNELWRHSAEYLYHIVKINNGSVSTERWHVGPEENALIQAFYWNPNSTSHDFVYVHNYNLYYQKDPEQPNSAVQLTVGGSTFNRFGIANWLYEEEILEVPGAVWWSPSGRYVSYLRFDDRDVNRIFLPKYTDEDSYVEYFELPYPKAGVANNSLVTQYIWDSENHKIVETAPPNELSSTNGNYYVLTNKWITMPKNATDLGQERLITLWTNRDQNHLYFSLCNEQDCVMVLSFPYQIDNRQLWIQPKDVRGIHPTETGFLTLLPHKHEDDNIYNHVAHIELDKTGTGKITKWIGENFDVLTILGYSRKIDALTFSAYGDGIGEHSIYIVKEALYGKEKTTLHKVSDQFDDCKTMGYQSADPTGERIVVQCEKPFDNTKLYLVDVADTTKKIMLDGATKAYIPFEVPLLKFGKFKIPSGIEGHYMLMKPPNLKDGAKIPLLVDIYGGPDSKGVYQRTPSAHAIQVVSQYDIAYAKFDVRGSGGRGWDVKEGVYKNLGEAETVDTLDMIREFLNNVNFIDEDRIAVMGWSYGGFLTSKIAIKDQGDLVKCALSIAPVTDFKYYDSAYTERYLGQPSDNPIGYMNTNVIRHARNVTNVNYFLAHGERDDNVHYQNSARWSEALQYNGVHFTQLVYANEAHSLSRKLHHLYSEIQRFLMDNCFKSNTDMFL